MFSFSYSIKYKHLTVQYDAEKNKLIYDRKLKDGSGESLYGLEVSKSLDLPQDFINIAYQIRDAHSTDSILQCKQSKYNATIIKGKCRLCGKSGDHM